MFDIVRPYIARNAYYAHSEFILMTMLADSSREKRSIAINHILDIRKKPKLVKNILKPEIRPFIIPNISFEAVSYDGMINWDNNTNTEPPITITMDYVELNKMLETPLVIPNFPNNTQSVERCIKLVTDASQQVYGFDSRDGFIRARIKSRSNYTKFDSKQDYN